MFTVHLKGQHVKNTGPPGTVCLWPLPEIPVPHPASVWLKCSVKVLHAQRPVPQICAHTHYSVPLTP